MFALTNYGCSLARLHGRG